MSNKDSTWRICCLETKSLRFWASCWWQRTHTRHNRTTLTFCLAISFKSLREQRYDISAYPYTLRQCCFSAMGIFFQIKSNLFSIDKLVDPCAIGRILSKGCTKARRNKRIKSLRGNWFMIFFSSTNRVEWKEKREIFIQRQQGKSLECAMDPLKRLNRDWVWAWSSPARTS